MFRLVKILNGRINVGETVRLPSKTSTTYQYGQALALSGGQLVPCGASVMPTHICGEEYVAPSADPKDIVATPVSPDMIFEAPFSAAPTSVNVGDKVTLADGMKVTATKDSGVATIYDKNGATAAGDKCLVQFK